MRINVLVIVLSRQSMFFLSFELQAVIAGRQGDLQRSQKLTKNANTCLVVGFILVAIVVYGGAIALLAWPFVVILV